MSVKLTNPDSTLVFQRSERIPLDVSSPIPLYHQVEQIILERISRDQMVDKMLPSEAELMEVFSVSRVTVKKALDNLASKGLLTRQRALGTKITRPQITESLTRLTSYSEEMRAKGLSIRTQTLFVGLHTPDQNVREKLALHPGEQTLCIERLRGTDEVFPVVLLHTEIPARFGINPHDDFTESLYRVIEEKYRVPITGAEEIISAARATSQQAKYLETKRGESVLVMERLTYTQGNVPLEYVQGVYRPDRYKFAIRLKR